MIKQIVNQKLSFSICMPVYKGHNEIKQAIDSLIWQEFQDFEIPSVKIRRWNSEKKLNKQKLLYNPITIRESDITRIQ